MFKQNFRPAWTCWDALFHVVPNTVTVPKLEVLATGSRAAAASAQAAVSAVTVAGAEKTGGGRYGFGRPGSGKWDSRSSCGPTG